MDDLRVVQSCQRNNYKEIPDIHVPGDIHEKKYTRKENNGDL